MRIWILMLGFKGFTHPCVICCHCSCPMSMFQGHVACQNFTPTDQEYQTIMPAWEYVGSLLDWQSNVSMFSTLDGTNMIALHLYTGLSLKDRYYGLIILPLTEYDFEPWYSLTPALILKSNRSRELFWRRYSAEKYYLIKTPNRTKIKLGIQLTDSLLTLLESVKRAETNSRESKALKQWNPGWPAHNFYAKAEIS